MSDNRPPSPDGKKKLSRQKSRVFKFRQNKHKKFRKTAGKDVTTQILEFRAYEFLCRQQEAKEWMEELLNTQLPPGTANFVDHLRDGVWLCRLANVFNPGSVKKIHENTTLQFRQTDNINAFFRATGDVGFPNMYLCSIPDLWEKRNITNVVHMLHALAHFLEGKGFQKIKNLTGAVFDADEINKTKEELAKIEERESLRSFNALGAELGAEEEEEEEEDDDEDDEEEEEEEDEYADPDECIVEGPGTKNATAGKEATFTIIARDKIGNDLDVGGEEFIIVLTHKETGETIDAEVEDHNNGKYTVTYTPEEAGLYDLEVKIEDFLLKDLPVTVTVEAEEISAPQNCTVEGSGIKSAVAGTKATFGLTAYDSFGNHRHHGGEAFRAVLTHSSKQGITVEAEVTDNGDGTYDFAYVCPDSGKYELEVKLGDVSVGSGPLSLLVKDTGISSPSKSYVEGVVTELVAGQETTFTIHAKDNLGNIRESGGEQFTATAKHTVSGTVVTAEITDTNEGLYHVKYQPTESGEYALEVKLKEDIIGSGEAITVAVKDLPESSPEFCTVEGEEWKQAIAGEHKTFLLQAHDKYRNKRTTGGEVFEIALGNKETGTEVLGEVKDLQNGSYELSYVVTESGTYVLEVTMKNADLRMVPIANFPAEVTVSDTGKTDAKKSEIVGDEALCPVSGQEVSFIVQARDQYSNKRPVGGDTVQVQLVHKKTGQSIDVAVVDNNNGTYKCTYLAHDWGQYAMEVSINGEKISSEPIAVTVKEPASVKELSRDALETIEPYDLLKSLKAEVEDDEEDSLISQIQDVKRQLVVQIRENNITEGGLKKLERKIELLIKNKIQIQEVLKSSQGFFSRKQKTLVRVDKENDEYKKKLELYSNLLYLLQTEPHYLAKCVYLVPQDKVDKFLETVILTLYGFAYSPREEYLILNLFKMALQLEISKSSGKVGGFLNENPVVPKMVVAYGRRLQGKQFLQEVLFNKLLKPFISDSTLNLDINPIKMLRDQITEEEVRTGVKNTTVNTKDLTNEEAMRILGPALSDRIKKLTDICQNILHGIIEQISEMPYGIRWVCKQIALLLKEKYPDATDAAVASVLGFMAIHKFINPAIVSPENFELTKMTISGVMRKNLALISQVLTYLSNNVFYDENANPHMAQVNEWLKTNATTFVNQFIGALIAVDDPEEHLGVHKYIELTQKTSPSVTISINELFSTHTVLQAFINQLAPSGDDPLKIIMKQLGPAPVEVPEEKNEELHLTLVNHFQKDVEQTEISAKQVYEETKELLRKCLRNIPTEKFGTSLVETLERASNYAKSKLDENAHDQIAAELDSKINTIMSNLRICEEAGIVQNTNGYRTILVDIARDAQNRKKVRDNQKKEIERLGASLNELREHKNYLEDKISEFNSYLQVCRETQPVNPKKKKSKAGKEVTFSYKQLQQKGVIVDMQVMNSQRSKVKFVLSNPEPGVFDVSAKLAMVTVKTIRLELDELLEKQSNNVPTLDFEYVTLDVNMTIHVINKLFVS